LKTMVNLSTRFMTRADNHITVFGDRYMRTRYARACSLICIHIFFVSPSSTYKLLFGNWDMHN
jgi:hypothetical protein